jgi:hypothetical protein
MIMYKSFSVSIIYKTFTLDHMIYLIKLNDVRMSDLLEYFDLSGDSLNVFFVLNLFFL